jgi:hypothetical protein
MPDTPVVRVETFDDLKKVLFIQHQITRRAHDELEAIASDNILDANTDVNSVKQYMKEEGGLLSAYAMRPTLTEWAQQSFEGQTASTWGATFGVALLTGELILEQVRREHPPLAAATKAIFMMLLAAETQAKNVLSDGEFENVVMSFNVAKPDGSPIDDPATKEKFRVALADVVATIIATGIEYGLFTAGDNGSHLITEVGTRVLFHMQDIQKFVAIMAEAHQRFQNEVPALMATLAEHTPPSRRKKRVSTSKPTT